MTSSPMVRALPLLVVLALAGCDSAALEPDAGRLDDASFVDAGFADAGPLDAGPLDAGPLDAGPLDAGPLDAGPLDAGPDGGPECSEMCSTPGASCDGSVLVTHDDARCEGGTCVFDTTRTDCPHGCASAACLPDPCSAVDHCPNAGDTSCRGDGLALCMLDADGCLAWGEPTACDAPADASPMCVGGGCDFVCDAGFDRCHDRCIPEGQRCGVELPDAMCSGSADCGDGQVCIDEMCRCAGRTRVCASGCCPFELAESEYPGIAGTGLALAFAADGTAYVAVRVQVRLGEYQLRLYSVAPDGAAAVALPVHLDVHHDRHAFALAVRSDGAVFLAARRGSGAILWRWAPGDGAPTRVGSLRGTSYSGVGLTIDTDDTAWMSVGTDSSFDAGVLEARFDGTTVAHSDVGFLQYASEADIEFNPVNGGIYAFWGHRYTGNYRRGTIAVDGSPEIRSCEGHDVAFGADGTSWSTYRTYPSIVSRVCRDRRTVPLAELSPHFPTVTPESFVDVDGEGTAFFVFTDDDRVRWVAGRDGERWSPSGIPGPDFEGNPHAAVAIDPSGQAVFAVLSDQASDGLRLVRQ